MRRPYDEWAREAGERGRSEDLAGRTGRLPIGEPQCSDRLSAILGDGRRREVRKQSDGASGTARQIRNRRTDCSHAHVAILARNTLYDREHRTDSTRPAGAPAQLTKDPRGYKDGSGFSVGVTGPKQPDDGTWLTSVTLHVLPHGKARFTLRADSDYSRLYVLALPENARSIPVAGCPTRSATGVDYFQRHLVVVDVRCAGTDTEGQFAWEFDSADTSGWPWPDGVTPSRAMTSPTTTGGR